MWEDRKFKFRFIFIVAVYLVMSIWWLTLFSVQDDYIKLIWAASYQVLAIIGWLIGLFIAKQWGGKKSVIGRGIIAFSLGLMLQNFGQSSFSFYNLILGVEIPYPSVADFGYFLSIFCYIYAVVQIAKVSGVVISLKSIKSKILVIIIPIVMLSISYIFFLQHYEFDWSNPLLIFLDFGYPLGQAVYVSLALLTYRLSKGILGGIMKRKVLFVLLALTIQYIADFNFLYQNINETWVNSGYGDYIYLLAYTTMAIGMLFFSPELISANKIQKK